MTLAKDKQIMEKSIYSYSRVYHGSPSSKFRNLKFISKCFEMNFKFRNELWVLTFTCVFVYYITGIINIIAYNVNYTQVYHTVHT